jgi:hypothetical protein
MLVKVVIDEISAAYCADRAGPQIWPGNDTSDEIYFIATGFLTQGSQSQSIAIPRICPPQKDYYRTYDPIDEPGTPALAAQQIGIWYGKLEPQQTLSLNVIVGEQDDGDLQAIKDAISGVLDVTGAIITGMNPLDKILTVAKTIFNDLTNQGKDKMMASFVVTVTNNGKDDQPQVQWTMVTPQYMTLQTAANAFSSRIAISGHDNYVQAQYMLNASVARAIFFRSLRSEKNIDVPGNSLADGVRLQQFTAKPHTNADSNQRWILWPQSIKTSEDHYHTYYQIVNENSLKCFDVAYASLDDHAAINQYTIKQAKDQVFQELPGDSKADWDNQLWTYDWAKLLIDNKNSRKVVDLPIYVPDTTNQDGVQLQQSDENNGDNQQWQMT